VRAHASYMDVVLHKNSLMSYSEFFPVGIKSVEIRFKCDNCNNEVLSEDIGVPSPNFSAEKASDSHNDNNGFAVCEHCQKEFDIWVYAGWSDGYVDVSDIEDEDIIEVIENADELDSYYEEQIDAILSSPNYDFLFLTEINNLKSLNTTDLGDSDLQKTLQRQIYSGAITCLEDYLSTTLVQQVLNNEENFKSFVRTFHNIRNRKFSLSEIYEQLDQIKTTVKKELLDVIYHDLPKVKGMYEDCLKITFPDIAEVMKAVKIRHDMVHRNGKNKNGNEIELSEQVVNDVITKVEVFVKAIDEEITKAQQKINKHRADLQSESSSDSGKFAK
jgi:transcription elongation factor Elf1